MHNLKNKTTFITGASNGIGKACAELFAEAGSNLILCARSLDKLEVLKEKLEELYSEIKIYVLKLDVSKRKEVEQEVKKIPKEFSDIDILVNNAGLGRGKDNFHECKVDDWEEMIDTNIKGLLYVSHAVVQGMVERKSGTIINVGSIAGIETYPRGNVYCATKSAVRTLSEGMRIDLVNYGIRVTLIEPAKVRTNFEAVRFHGKDDPRRDNYINYTPLEAKDVADAILYAASRPPHVQIARLGINPTDQASATIIRKKV